MARSPTGVPSEVTPSGTALLPRLWSSSLSAVVRDWLPQQTALDGSEFDDSTALLLHHHGDFCELASIVELHQLPSISVSP